MEDKKPTMVSIIIPVFNLLSYTKQCLSHIEQYTDIPYELIIIDNGSTDGTKEFLKSVNAKIIFNDENKGVYTAWNQGIRESKSEHIIIMNNDILVTPHWASELLKFSRLKPGRVVGPAMREGPLNYPLIEYSKNLTAACKNASRKLELCNFSLVLCNRRFFDEAGLFDERFFVTRGDDDIILRFKEKGIREAVTGSAFVHHFSEKTQEATLDIKELRKRDDFLFYEKWGKSCQPPFLDKLRSKLSLFFIPYYEKIRYGYSLKTPKPKQERLAKKIST